MLKPSYLWLLFLLLVSGISGVLAYKGMTQPTGPHQLRWLDAQNKPLFGHKGPLRVSSCQGDRYFRTLSMGRWMWTACVQGLYTPRHHTRHLNGVYVRLDMKQKIARASWPLPKDYMLYHTLGLLPNSDGKLGIVYRSRHSHGPTVVAVAGDKGWWVPPTPLPDKYSGRLLGMRWNQGKLAVVVAESRLMDRLGLRSPAAIFQFTSRQKPTHQLLPRSMICQAKKPCRIELAYPGKTRNEWRFMVLQQQAWEVTLRTRTPDPGQERSDLQLRTPDPGLRTQKSYQIRHRLRKDWSPYSLWLRRRLDVSFTGILPQRALALERRWQPTGTLPLLDSLKGWDNNQLIRQSGNFVFKNGQLHHRTWWIHRPHGIIHRVAQQRIRIGFQRISHKPKPKPKFFHSKHHKQSKKLSPLIPVSMELQRIEAWRTKTLGSVGRFPPQRCPSLSIGAWVERPKKLGYWLVSPSGCYLTLNKKWQRVDSVPLMTHLKQRARNQRRPLPSLWGLGWLLLGGPFCLLLGIFWSQRETQDTSETSDSVEESNTSTIMSRLAPFLVLLAFLLSAIYPWMQWKTFF